MNAMAPSVVELEQRAERAVRRGELLNALEVYEAILAQQPEDERLRARMESVRSLLQPSELVHRRKAEPLPASEPSAPLSAAEQGELHAAEGRLVEAAQAYRDAVAKNPGNELLRERLLELMKLLPSDKSALDDGLARAERLDKATPAQGTPVLDDHRSAKAADAVFRPLTSGPIAITKPPPAPLPRDPVKLLQALLDRIAKAGRR